MVSAAAPDLSLLEREPQLAPIDRALQVAGEGHGSLVLVEGPAGIGKSAVLGAACSRASTGGMRILRARGAELEREYAFGVIRQLFEPALGHLGHDERADVLQGPAGVAARVLGLHGAVSDPEPMAPADASFAVLHGLYWLCANLAAKSPLCLVIDDAHWADAPSLRYLAFLLERLRELPAAVLMAARPGDGGPGDGLLAGLAANSLTELARPAPLSQHAVGQLVSAELTATADAGFVGACHHVTGGTPFLVGQLLVALREAGVPPTDAAAEQVRGMGSRAIGRWMLVRLGRLPAAAADLARAVSVLERADLAHAALLAGLTVEEAVTAADQLVAAGILVPERPLAFVHPIIRSAVYEELSPGERARGHRKAAELLDEAHALGERVAEHLLASDPSGDEWVADRLAAVATAATQSGAPETAAVYLRRALAEPPPPARRAALLLDLGLAEESAGEPEWSAHLQAALAASEQDVARIEAALVLAPALGRAQRSVEAVEMIDRAAGWLGSGDGQLSSMLEAAAVSGASIHVATAPAVQRRAAAIRRRADTDDDPVRELLGVAGFIAALTNEPADVAAELARRTLAAGPTLPDAVNVAWFSQAVVTLLWSGRYDGLDELLEAVIVEARGTGNSALLSIGLSHRGWLALHRGDLRAAETDTRTALDAAQLPAPLLYRLLNAGILVEALVDRGALEEADAVLGPLDPGSDAASLSTLVLRQARGRLRLAQHRAREALGDFEAVGHHAARLSITSPAWLPWRSHAALAHLALGEIEPARSLAAGELALARASGAPRAIGIALRATGVIEGGPRGEALLRESVATLVGSDAALEHTRASIALGAHLRRANRRREARDILRPALAAAHHAGAQALADHAATELRATGARPRRVMLTGLDSLTASERRVAELGSEGLTNREIAQTLFVTARTVEGHLTQVFAKLDIPNREALAGALSAA